MVVPKCYMLLCMCVYDLDQYDYLTAACSASCFVLQSKNETSK